MRSIETVFIAIGRFFALLHPVASKRTALLSGVRKRAEKLASDKREAKKHLARIEVLKLQGRNALLMQRRLQAEERFADISQELSENAFRIRDLEEVAKNG